MTRPPLDLADLRALLDALCEESITAEQLRRLEELVLAHPEAEAYYVQYMSLHADLAGCFGVSPNRTGETLRRRVGGEEEVGETRRQGDREARGSREKEKSPSASRLRLSLSPRLLVSLSALTAGLLLASAWALWPRPSAAPAVPDPTPEASDDTVAVLVEAPGAVWDAADPPRAGALLPPGWLRLKAGYAHLEFYSGAVVILEGPAELNLISPMEAFCARGKLRATVPRQAQGFTVRSPALDLVDRGTEFGLRVGAGDGAEVHVFQGKVELYDPGGAALPESARQELTTGHGVRLDGPGASRPIAADPATFKTAEDVAECRREAARRRQREWAEASDALRRDPGLVVYYTFQDEEEGSRTLLDQAGGRRQPHDGAVVGCAWSAGRWPGRRGLEFKRVSDRVRFHVPGEFDALTLAAWVRVDALPNRFNSLMMTDGWEEAAPHWHVSDAGRVELGVQGWDAKGGVHYLTPPVLTPDRLGEWVHLAVVYDRDAGQVTHYVDGRPFQQEPIKLDIPLRIGDVELGNWNLGARPHKSPIRYFSGCIDEFMLFSRALGDDEIERLYTQGRPPS
jgi:hypothetical protein